MNPQDEALSVTQADELRALIAKATDEDLCDGGRYFADSYFDLTKCSHGETGEYQHSEDGELIEWLWNNRHKIADSLATSPRLSHSTPGDAEVRSISVAEEWNVYMTEAVNNAPEPLRKLGEYLAELLDEDQWKKAERYLNGALLATPSGRAQAWLPIEDAPRDGTEIVAAIKVRHIKGGMWWERHVIAADEETGELHPDYDHGWTFDDYELWMPLADLPELPAAPPAQDQGEGR